MSTADDDYVTIRVPIPGYGPVMRSEPQPSAMLTPDRMNALVDYTIRRDAAREAEILAENPELDQALTDAGVDTHAARDLLADWEANRP